MFGLVDAEQHQACFSFISGIVFGVSWIIFIAGAALDASLLPFNGPIIPAANGTAAVFGDKMLYAQGPSVVGLCFVPVLLVTVAMFMMNTVDSKDLEEHSGVAHKLKLWMFFAGLLLFGGLIAACWILAGRVSIENKNQSPVIGACTLAASFGLVITTLSFYLARNMTADGCIGCGGA